MGIRGFKGKGWQGPAWLLPVLIIIVLAAAIFGYETGKEASPRAEEQAPSDQVAALTGAAVGAMAIPFELKTFDGEVVKLEEMRGAPVVVNFWASWCGPCRLEAPVLREAYYAFMGTGVAFVGVAVQDREEDSKAFIEEYSWTFPVGPDPTEEIMRAYRVFGIPKTFIIDKNGRISYIATGAVSEELLTREIEKVL